jgi:hypothetical protein
MSTTTETVRDEASVRVPAGFRRATAADLTDRPDGWVGPKIHAPYLVNGRPETAATVAWTPEEGMAPILNEDVYPDIDSSAAKDAFERLQTMLTYAALETEATSPSELARAYRASEDNAYNFTAPWDGNQSQHHHILRNANDEATLTASTVVAGGLPIGLHLTVALEDFEGLGLDVVAESNMLELTGTREEIAAAADLFAKMGAELMSFLNKRSAE